LVKTWKITWGGSKPHLIYICKAKTREDALQKFARKIRGVTSDASTVTFNFLYLGGESINVFLKRYSGLSIEEAMERFNNLIKIEEEV